MLGRETCLVGDPPSRMVTAAFARPASMPGRSSRTCHAQVGKMQRLVVTDRLVRATHPPSVARLTRGVPWLCVPRSRGVCRFVVRAISRGVASAFHVALVLVGSGRGTSSRLGRVLHAPPSVTRWSAYSLEPSVQINPRAPSCELSPENFAIVERAAKSACVQRERL